MVKYKVSQRLACRALGINRTAVRYKVKKRSDEDTLTALVTELALQYGRYGYRIICGIIRNMGYLVNHKRVERIWRT
ncbi:MAG: IS3 family transposase [Firmicutes bacterium]|nr:IS3 family transposase [Bacillota bacterium]